MTPKNTGWTIFIAALGMMATLTAADIKDLKDWSEMFHPGFVASMLLHFGTVVAAFVAGKIIPSSGDKNG